MTGNFLQRKPCEKNNYDIMVFVFQISKVYYTNSCMSCENFYKKSYKEPQVNFFFSFRKWGARDVFEQGFVVIRHAYKICNPVHRMDLQGVRHQGIPSIEINRGGLFLWPQGKTV